MNRTFMNSRPLGIILKTCVIASCLAGIATHSKSASGIFMSSMFKAFTIQSNIWIALISAVFLLIESLRKSGNVRCF